ncbi:MAG: aminotransferase class V-fold PLP-dependent enzyme [Acidobacteria bacterium]|nr:aminotransferase class V-fold PLP-dependent enzyme [Acidobacteriota bacterium]
MTYERREFLQSAAALSAAALASVPMTESLDAIKAAFSKAKDRAPNDVAKDESLWAEVRKAYNYSPDVINMASVVRGVAPKVVSDAVIDTYTRVNEFRPGGNYNNVGERQATIRQRLAAHVRLATEEIATTRNTTDGVTTVIAGLKLQAGDEILTTTEEHNAYYGILYQRAARDGLKVRCVPLPAAQTPDELAEAMEKAVTPRTRLIFICHVYMSGQIFPVRRLCDFAHHRGIKVLVDGALAFGHINVDVKALDCDFYAASLHKWGGGPPATGLFYVKREHIAALPPLYGYFDGKTRQAAFNSDRMEKYTSFGNHLSASFLSIGQMLDFREAIGQQNIQARLHYLKRYWAEQVKDEKRLKLLASLDPQLSCSLLSFDVMGGKRSDVTQPLWEQHKIMLGGAYVKGEFGKLETWQEITLCNTALFHSLEQLNRFAAALKKTLRSS